MSESFLHYIWLFQYYSKINLATTAGDSITVFNTGFPNAHAGPDFQNCRLRIGAIEWVGSVEVHINSSAWREHGHQTDPSYENVVLHVVWYDDKPVSRIDGTRVPTLELKDRVDEKLIGSYKKLLNDPHAIPCSTSLHKVEALVMSAMLDKVLAVRLESKSNEVLAILQHNNGDWEETCFQLLARNFGFKVNAEPFMQLAKSIPYKIIMKHSDKLEQIEALLLGQAGFLEDRIFPDEYYGRLQREYHLLCRKFGLKFVRMNMSQWKFLRMRPANFPALRIAQFSALICRRKNLFSAILDSEDRRDLKSLLSVEQSAYWTQHYHFGISSKPEYLGDSSIDKLIVNSAVPLMVAWSRFRDEQRFMDKALAILQEVKGESNNITRQWHLLGIGNNTAADSQALLELYNHFCSRRRCLDCNIGASLIRPL